MKRYQPVSAVNWGKGVVGDRITFHYKLHEKGARPLNWRPCLVVNKPDVQTNPMPKAVLSPWAPALCSVLIVSEWLPGGFSLLLDREVSRVC